MKSKEKNLCHHFSHALYNSVWILLSVKELLSDGRNMASKWCSTPMKCWLLYMQDDMQDDTYDTQAVGSASSFMEHHLLTWSSTVKEKLTWGISHRNKVSVLYLPFEEKTYKEKHCQMYSLKEDKIKKVLGSERRTHTSKHRYMFLSYKLFREMENWWRKIHCCVIVFMTKMSSKIRKFICGHFFLINEGNIGQLVTYSTLQRCIIRSTE